MIKTLLKKSLVAVLSLEARFVLRKYKPTVIGVTGNVGKTSTKEAIYTVLAKSHFVRKSEKSMNTEYGVPLSILGCDSGWNDPIAWAKILIEGLSLIFLKHHYPKYLVLEVGADHPGDIPRIAKWLKPDVAVITAVPDVPVHVEFFASADEMLKEKRALAEAVPMDGKIILDGDNQRVRGLLNDFRSRAITFGIEKRNDIYASHPEMMMRDGLPVGMRFRINQSMNSIPLELVGVLGSQQMSIIAAASAVAVALGIDLVTAMEALRGHVSPPGRMRLIPGLKGSLIVDDTYNASPAAMHAALDTLQEIPVKAGRGGGRKIAILGDMLELGKFTAQEHKAAGEHAAKAAQALITVGVRARKMAEAARAAKMREDRIVEYGVAEAERAGLEVKEMLRKGDIVLVKGSQGIRLERAVKELMAEPELAGELLVRQSDEWSER